MGGGPAKIETWNLAPVRAWRRPSQLLKPAQRLLLSAGSACQRVALLSNPAGLSGLDLAISWLNSLSLDEKSSKQRQVPEVVLHCKLNFTFLNRQI